MCKTFEQTLHKEDILWMVKKIVHEKELSIIRGIYIESTMKYYRIWIKMVKY